MKAHIHFLLFITLPCAILNTQPVDQIDQKASANQSNNQVNNIYFDDLMQHITPELMQHINQVKESNNNGTGQHATQSTHSSESMKSISLTSDASTTGHNSLPNATPKPHTSCSLKYFLIIPIIIIPIAALLIGKKLYDKKKELHKDNA